MTSQSTSILFGQVNDMAVKKIGRVKLQFTSKDCLWLNIKGADSFILNPKHPVDLKLPSFPDRPKDVVEVTQTVYSKKWVTVCPKCNNQFLEKSVKCPTCYDGFLKSTKLIPREVDTSEKRTNKVPNNDALEKYEKEYSEKTQDLFNKIANKIIRPYRAIKAKNAVLYNGCVYSFDRADYSDEEMVLQIMDLEDEERRKFERLKHKFTVAEEEEKKGKRLAIPEEVRIAVWRRDSGKCVRCDSRENLEYDHIIPISKGGNNTARNIELLCERCNREKSNNIQ